MASTKTIKTSGGDYTSLSAWEAGMQGDLTGTGVAEAVCYSLDDTTAVTIGGWTTTASDYIYIHADASGRHAGKWDGDKYNLVPSDATALTVNENFVRTDGLQLGLTSPSAARNGILVNLISASNDIRFSNLIIKGHGNNSYGEIGFCSNDTDVIAYLWNSIIYNCSTNAASRAAAIHAATCSIYSSVLLGGAYALRTTNGTTTAKNVYAGGSATEDFVTTATLNKTNCASEDASADDTNTTVETQSNCITGVALDTDTFVNVTGGSEDFHLAADGLSPLQGAGVDTSGESAPLNFTTDIDGDTRDATWDIGADSWVVSATTKYNQVVMMC